MRLRRFLAGLCIIYGILIPLLARNFFFEHFWTCMAMIGCCFIFAFLFFSGKAFLINLILAAYIFQFYLVRPYISLFEDQLTGYRLRYMMEINSFFNFHDAMVVYGSLFSLLLAWMIGVTAFKTPYGLKTFRLPKLFKCVDDVISKRGLPLWITWAVLTVLNYQSPEKGLLATETGEGTGSFAFGLASLTLVNNIFLFQFIYDKQNNPKKASYLSLIPATVGIATSVVGGSRGAMFFLVIFAMIYWSSLNKDRVLKVGTIVKNGILMGCIALFTISSALLSNLIRPLYRFGYSRQEILNAIDFNSFLLAQENLYFGLTQLLHRMSALQAQFLILNDHFYHQPWQYFNPVGTIKRIINDLLPGDYFSVLNINQLFNYIYFNEHVYYNSEMWGIQGTLYLYFGFFFSCVVTCVLGMTAVFFYPSLDKSVKESPAFATFFILLFHDFIANGTLERMISSDIVRPISSLIVFFFLIRILSTGGQLVNTRVRGG